MAAIQAHIQQLSTITNKIQARSNKLTITANAVEKYVDM